MDMIAIFLIAISLSFDTFAVSVSCGVIDNNIKFWPAVRIAFYFATFQALMPLLGYSIGSTLSSIISPIDHWVAFALLSIVGAKMLIESFTRNFDNAPSFNPHQLKIVLSLSLATSIDAFVVGISFAFFSINLILSLFIIGSVTFMLSMLGMLFGKKLGQHLGKKIEFLGGLILITLGLKILLEHLSFL